MKKVLLTATVQSHIAQFHKPLIKMLQQNQYEVHVAARNNLSEKNGLALTEPDKTYDIPFERNPFNKNNLKAFNELREILKETSYDIVHCNTPVGGVLTRLAANNYRKNGLEVFYTAHGFHFYKESPLKNWIIYYPIEKNMANITDKLITITEEDYKLAKNKFNISTHRIHGVGVNPLRFYPVNEQVKNQNRLVAGYKENEFIILCTGELNENKNQEIILKALPDVLKKNKNTKLLIAGNGPLEKQLKNLCFTLQIDEHVDFLGYRPDIERFVFMSDLVVSASKREGLGLNIIEAMFCEKPVIASRNRGHSELIQPGVTGSLVSYDNPESFSSEIIKYMENPIKTKKIAKSGLLSVKQYSDANVVKELKGIYEI